MMFITGLKGFVKENMEHIGKFYYVSQEIFREFTGRDRPGITGFMVKRDYGSEYLVSFYFLVSERVDNSDISLNKIDLEKLIKASYNGVSKHNFRWEKHGSNR